MSSLHFTARQLECADEALGSQRCELPHDEAEGTGHSHNRGKLRRRNQRYSPLTPLLQLWEPFLLTTGAGIGQLA